MKFFAANERRIAALEAEVLRLSKVAVMLQADALFSIRTHPLQPDLNVYPLSYPVSYHPLRDVLQAMLTHLNLAIEPIPAAREGCRLVPVKAP